MNPQLRRDALEKLRLIREENAKITEMRMEQAFCADGRIREKVQSRHKMVLSFIEGSLGGSLPFDPEREMARYNEEIRALLRQNNLPEDYLQPVCTCEKCGDTGFVGEQNNIPCECLRRIEAALRAQEGDQEETFEQFDEGVFSDEILPSLGVSQRRQMTFARDKCAEFAQSFEKKRQDLLISGSSGLGKTYLLHCIARRAAERGLDVCFMTAFEALQELRNDFYGRESRAQRLFQAQLLVLDDLGMEPLLENVTVEQLYNLLNSRRSRGLCTAISTNLTPSDLRKRYTERIYSRLFDKEKCQVLALQGRDVRLNRSNEA